MWSMLFNSITREKSYHFLNVLFLQKISNFHLFLVDFFLRKKQKTRKRGPGGKFSQVLHGCLKFVSQDVRVPLLTSGLLIFIIIFINILDSFHSVSTIIVFIVYVDYCVPPSTNSINYGVKTNPYDPYGVFINSFIIL